MILSAVSYTQISAVHAGRVVMYRVNSIVKFNKEKFPLWEGFMTPSVQA